MRKYCLNILQQNAVSKKRMIAFWHAVSNFLSVRNDSILSSKCKSLDRNNAKAIRSKTGCINRIWPNIFKSIHEVLKKKLKKEEERRHIYYKGKFNFALFEKRRERSWMHESHWVSVCMCMHLSACVHACLCKSKIAGMKLNWSI